jgi:ASCH domain
MESLSPPRVLSIRQPWAQLVVAGIKRVENRSKRTHYRGPVLIQAARACARTTPSEIEQRWGVVALHFSAPPSGWRWGISLGAVLRSDLR